MNDVTLYITKGREEAAEKLDEEFDRSNNLSY